VHLVPRVGQIQVEIQIRTELQDSWAQIFERLADFWGRGIRYGQDPENPEARVRSADTIYSRRDSVQLLMRLSDSIFDLERTRQRTNNLSREAAQIETVFSGMRESLNPAVLTAIIPPYMTEHHERIAGHITSGRYEELINAECRELLDMGNRVTLAQSIQGPLAPKPPSDPWRCAPWRAQARRRVLPCRIATPCTVNFLLTVHGVTSLACLRAQGVGDLQHLTGRAADLTRGRRLYACLRSGGLPRSTA
jgi:hypothetical protein